MQELYAEGLDVLLCLRFCFYLLFYFSCWPSILTLYLFYVRIADFYVWLLHVFVEGTRPLMVLALVIVLSVISQQFHTVIFFIP